MPRIIISKIIMTYSIIKKIQCYLRQEKIWEVIAIPDCSSYPIPSSVLMIIYPQGKKLFTLFILRSSSMIHGGQIALPGGKINKGEAILDAALRESNEEISLRREEVSILGSLPPYYIPISNHYVFPIVGYTPMLPYLKANPKEVSKIIHIPLDMLSLNDLKYEKKDNLPKHMIYPFIDINDEVMLWGATLSIVLSFTKIYHKVKQTNIRL